MNAFRLADRVYGLGEIELKPKGMRLNDSPTELPDRRRHII